MPKRQVILSDSTPGMPPSTNISRSRRQFIVNATAAGVIATLAPGCTKIREVLPGHDHDVDTINLGSGDFGIVNYCYLLQQLEAAFYTKVLQTPFEGMREHETAAFISIYNHEIAHREFYKNVLGTAAVKQPSFTFTTIAFKERAVVLQTGKSFEDLVTAAYTGIASKIVDLKFLADNAKVVSVDARHAAVLANLDLFGSFANAVGVNGVEPAWTPSQVMAVAQLYIVEKINFQGISF